MSEGSISVGPVAMNHTHSLAQNGEEVQTVNGTTTTYKIMDCTDPGCGYSELDPA